MSTITQSLFAANRSSAPLTPAQADGITAALAPMGLDPRDANGASLMGMTSEEAMRLFGALGTNSAAGDIVAASESDGTRLAIVDGRLRLLDS